MQERGFLPLEQWIINDHHYLQPRLTLSQWAVRLLTAQQAWICPATLQDYHNPHYAYKLERLEQPDHYDQ